MPITSEKTQAPSNVDSDDDLHDGNESVSEKEWETIMRKYHGYISFTFNELGAASSRETHELDDWLSKQKKTRKNLESLRQLWETHYKEQQKSAEKLYYAEFMPQLLAAREHDPPLVSLESMKEWVARFKDPEYPYKEKEKFVREKLPDYIRRWKKVSLTRRSIIKDPRFALLKKSPVITQKQLKLFLSNADFINLHYDDRSDLVKLMETALHKIEHGLGIEKLKVLALEKLEAAADEGILAKNKIGKWMKRIFMAEYSVEEIQDFLDNKGAFPFATLEGHWRKVKGRFDSIEKQRKDVGTPQSFRFVTTNVFLDWEYEKRKTYVDEAERRFREMESQPELFTRIRHELDAEDWVGAEELITQAQGRNWSTEDADDLKSMEEYLKAHRGSSSGESTEKESPSPDEVLGDMREALNMMPSDSIRNRFIIAMEQYDYQTLWALCTMYYNWEWCRLHGYSSDELDADFRETAKEETYDAIEHGTSRGHVNYDATTDTSVVMRDDNDTRSAQAIHVDNTTDNGQLIHKISMNKDNRAVWYWTRIMEKETPFELVRYMIYNLQPKLKKGMRKLDKMGYRFTRAGPAQKKTGGTAEQTHSAKTQPTALF